MKLNVDEKKLKEGVLGLVMALVEIIHEALKHQAVRRIEGKSLNDREIERLGKTLRGLENAIAQIKKENGIEEAVSSIRQGLDDVVDRAISDVVNPSRWAIPSKREGS